MCQFSMSELLYCFSLLFRALMVISRFQCLFDNDQRHVWNPLTIVALDYYTVGVCSLSNLPEILTEVWACTHHLLWSFYISKADNSMHFLMKLQNCSAGNIIKIAAVSGMLSDLFSEQCTIHLFAKQQQYFDRCDKTLAGRVWD